jgi:hypothetical protein
MLTTISEVNKTPDHVLPQPDLGTSSRARNLDRTIALHEPGFEKGYDSDGDIGPFWDAIEDEGEQEEQDDEEEEATAVANETTIDKEIDEESEQEQEQTTTITTTDLTMTSGATTTNIGHHVPIANDLIDKILRPQIVIELRKRDLNVSGKKEIVRARLKQGMKDEVPVVVAAIKNPNPKKKKATKRTSNNAPKKTSTISFNLARAPTVPEDEADNVTVKKWNFAEKFERPGFLGRYPKLVKMRNGRQKMDANGLPVSEFAVREKGMPDPEFVKKHKLSVNSTPTEFIEVFVPFYLNPYNGKPKKDRVYPSIQTWTEWTNKKQC